MYLSTPGSKDSGAWVQLWQQEAPQPRIQCQQCCNWLGTVNGPDQTNWDKNFGTRTPPMAA